VEAENFCIVIGRHVDNVFTALALTYVVTECGF